VVGMGRFWINVVPVWLLTSAGVILVGLGVGEQRRVGAMVAVLAVSVIASFALQVLAYRSGGLVRRLSWATAGSVAITAAAAVIFQMQTVIE
jgi:hypothetical protein